MLHNTKTSAFILGLFLFLGLFSLGYLLSSSAIKIKEYERTVTVKGLSEQEFKADIVIWPVQFTQANNSLAALYDAIELNTQKIQHFLKGKGITEDEITLSPPSITDLSAQQYGNAERPEFRYTAIQTITIYSKNIDTIRHAMSALATLGKQGIVLSNDRYEYRTEYLFTRLNEVKPQMIEEATQKAREVAEKFAIDSKSRLGKIKKASQGQFSVAPRDANNPHIKKIRVVSTVIYYLSD